MVLLMKHILYVSPASIAYFSKWFRRNAVQLSIHLGGKFIREVVIRYGRLTGQQIKCVSDMLRLQILMFFVSFTARTWHFLANSS
jgi:hypothetical protein